MRNVGDDDAKAHVEVTLDGQHIQVLEWRQNPGSTPSWTWRWRFDTPNAAGYTLRFFHDCDAGCLAWTQARIGQPDAPELRPDQAANEPLTDLNRAEWNGAQAGFRVYQDWLSIVNAYTTTRGLPVYINSTSTFTPEQNMSPAQNYPQGWLTSALKVVNDEPQIQALCWFMDSLPDDPNWDPFSLTNRQGKLAEADDEFGELLRR